MKIQTFQRWVALGTAFFWTASLGVSTAHADGVGERRPTVQISVYNDAGLKRGTLRLAEKNAATVFSSAGIETEWLNCGGSEVGHGIATPSREQCGQVAYPSKLVLRIGKRPRGLVPEVFGVAYLSQDGQGAYCDVFVEPMEDLQKLYPVTLDAILGHVAAHEIAHLLLGPRSHSPTGVMLAHWNSRTIEDLGRGLLAFTPTQSSAMADRLSFARDTAPAALAAMAEPPPVTLDALPLQCPNSH